MEQPKNAPDDMLVFRVVTIAILIMAFCVYVDAFFITCEPLFIKLLRIKLSFFLHASYQQAPKML